MGRKGNSRLVWCAALMYSSLPATPCRRRAADHGSACPAIGLPDPRQGAGQADQPTHDPVEIPVGQVPAGSDRIARRHVRRLRSRLALLSSHPFAPPTMRPHSRLRTGASRRPASSGGSRLIEPLLMDEALRRTPARQLAGCSERNAAGRASHPGRAPSVAAPRRGGLRATRC